MWYGDFAFITAFMVNVNIEDLSLGEAEAFARKCTRGAQSKQEVKDLLNNAGFYGNSAAIDGHYSLSGDYMFMAMLNHPNGEIISI
jgi:hypothetical protein